MTTAATSQTSFYVSPTGSGNGSGKDWANAAKIDKIADLVKLLPNGGQILLAADAGSYKVTTGINIWSRGDSDKLGEITIKGVSRATGEEMNAVIEGTRNPVYNAQNASGNELFRVNKGADKLSFENMTINNTGTAIRVLGDVDQISVSDMQANNVARFFENAAGGNNKTATINGLSITDVQVDGFSKGVIRLQDNTNNVVIDNVHGDSKRQDGDNFAIGVHLDGTVHKVLIKNSTMGNISDTVGGRFWNGDGFASERGVSNIIFQDTKSFGNTDAGYDIKSTKTVLIRAEAEDNARNFKIWSDAKLIDPVGLNPHIRGGIGIQAQIQAMSTANVTVEGGFFADAGSKTKNFSIEGQINFTDTQVTSGKGATLFEGKGGSAVKMLAPKNFKLVESHSLVSEGKGWSLPDVNVLPPTASDGDIVVITPPKIIPPVAPPPPPPPVVVAPTGPNKITLGLANEILTAKSGQEMFRIDVAAKTGQDVIQGFGKHDTLALSQTLRDGNRDGIINPGSDKAFDLGQGDLLKLNNVKEVRYLGQNEDGHHYADASVRLKGMREGSLGDNQLAGDANDAKGQDFLFDTALKLGLGKDDISRFGSKDILVTTSSMTAMA
jgi:hypothetical protein